MIPHWKRSLFATLQAFHVQQLCTSKEKEPSEKRRFVSILHLLLLHLLALTLPLFLCPQPFTLFSTCRTQEKADKAKKHLDIFPTPSSLQGIATCQTIKRKKVLACNQPVKLCVFFFTLQLSLGLKKEWQKVTLLKSTIALLFPQPYTAFPEPIIIHTVKELSIWNFNLTHER